MFKSRIPLFSVFGFQISIDPTWIVLAALVTWSLASGYFPQVEPGLAESTYWWMGVAGALGLFFSIVVHELSHSLVARRFDLPIKGITLFIFGGIAEMQEEPRSAKAEFLTAIVGPLTSFALAAIFFVLSKGLEGGESATPLHVLVEYLAFINMVVAVFNLLPAFPLDGGRVLRAALWAWKGDLTWATRVASNSGSLLGLALIILGVVNFVQGFVVGGVWWVLIGFFVRMAAQGSYQQVITREFLSDVPVERLMTREPITVDPDLTVTELIDRYFYRYYFQGYPVVRDGRLLGIVTLRDLTEEVRQKADFFAVSRVMRPLSEENAVAPGSSAMEALSLMNRTGASRLLVADGDSLSGILSMKDVMRLLQIRLQLQAGTAARQSGLD
jgi:Zn-dependent protease